MRAARRRDSRLIRALALVVTVAACTPAPIPSSGPATDPHAGTAAPTLPPIATPSISTDLQSEPTVEPLIGLPAEAFTIPDSIIVASLEDWPTLLDDEPRETWRLKLEVIPRDGPRVGGSFLVRPPAGWVPLRDYTMLKVSTDGVAAMTISTRNGGVDNNTSTLVVDLVGDRGMSGPILGNYPAWLPDGSLLLMIDHIEDGIPEVTARRVMDHGFGRIADVRVNQDGSWAQWASHHLVAHRDLSGVNGFRANGNDFPELVTIRWDGTVLPRDRLDVPILSLGNERWTGANGEQTTGPGAMEDIPTMWQRADGTVERVPGFMSSISWTRDGAALVARGGRIGAGESDMAKIQDVDGQLRVQPLDALPVGSAAQIVGMTDWAAILEDLGGGDTGFTYTVTLIPFDGSSALGPYVGVLAAVNP